MRVAVSNYATPGDVAWIEQRRLQRALAQGAGAPDLVVFYDGFNDLRAQTWAYESGRGIRDQFMSVHDRDLLPLLDDLVGEERDGNKVMVAEAVDPMVWRVETEADFAAVVEGTVFQYGASVRSSRRFLAERGIPMFRFFQPWVNTQDPVATGDFPQSEVLREKAALLRGELPEGREVWRVVANTFAYALLSGRVWLLAAALVLAIAAAVTTSVTVVGFVVVYPFL